MQTNAIFLVLNVISGSAIGQLDSLPMAPPAPPPPPPPVAQPIPPLPPPTIPVIAAAAASRAEVTVYPRRSEVKDLLRLSESLVTCSYNEKIAMKGHESRVEPSRYPPTPKAKGWEEERAAVRVGPDGWMDVKRSYRSVPLLHFSIFS